jgi:gluconolactonase
VRAINQRVAPRTKRASQRYRVPYARARGVFHRQPAMQRPEGSEAKGDRMGAELTTGELERLFTGSVWGEGPLWVPSSQTLRWSDIPNDRILEFDPATGLTREYGRGVEFSNGRTLDPDGTVIQCSHGRRRVERDRGGVVTGLVESFQGRRLNSPNDVVVARDSTIWFTDPPYGILPGTKEGHEGEQEYGGCYVFRYEPATGTLTPVITDLVHPNGLAFSSNESVLYVSDTAGPGYGVPLQVVGYDVSGGICHRNGAILELVEGQAADGLRVDVQDRIWTSAGPAVRIYSPSFELLGTVDVPETVSNLCFGGPDGQDLYITATTSLYRIRTTTRGAHNVAPKV